METKKVVALKRLSVRAKVDSFSGCDFEGNLSDLLSTIDRLITKHGADAYLDWCSEGYEPYTDSAGYVLYKNRPETNEEWEERTSVERKRLKEIEDRERKEYDRLKKKFDGQV